jgi:Ca-activated chloride channel family protein
MNFAYPFIFWLVLAITLFGGIFFWWQKRQKKMYALKIPFLSDLQKAEKKSGKFSSARVLKYLQWFFFALAVIFLTIALARPQAITEEKKISKNGVDILIALDVSESMLAEDLTPNRMEAAKKYIDEFVSKLTTDRVGLEVFAGKPFTQSPMSFDYNVIRYYLSEISTDTIDQRRRGFSGTAIGDSIVAAVNRFENSPERTNVLVLLTDGEDTASQVDPIFATEHARSKGIKIYTIGLGKKEGAPIKIKDALGNEVYARNPDGSIY